ncbi:TIGR01457 family HAD-type hydrolase [Alkalicoccobacillus porphyridii]|uniref:TIGR01457 family HAD-type hydrolase n=1 Tax=Alkalicoccobacillus porphyridii TaxID=2597270 RepID=A0A554A3F7_9BACI|nr:TIGR01457 family HAD-type hydrolase [Alkalicoccobacillus porphyridii]TSB48215.1 TIGR01457 family HAD-type hydrolase [Alkalicoccobacillus porphyridii]
MGYKGYLLDLDGTMYRGGQAIPEAVEFVHELKRRQLPYLFVTNNSTKTQEAVAEHLQGFGVPVKPHQVFTSGMAASSYLSEQTRAYIVGESGLKQALKKAGHIETDQQVDAVVVGLDREFTYEKLKRASLLIQQGAQLIATNGDKAIPSEDGLVPGNGSIVAAIATASQTEPLFVGKPEAIMMKQALAVLGTDPRDTIMVGDNYQTDILAGIQAGLDTLLVFSGVTTAAQVNLVDIKPTFTHHSLSEWTLFE